MLNGTRVVMMGGRGQLGIECQAVLPEPFEVVCLDVQDLDVGDRKQCLDALDRHQPAIVLNCAAFTDVDKCETERVTAWRVNAEAPGFMAEWVERNGAFLIHISTDFVFDGERALPEPYGEDDTPAPISYYGESKLGGERAVMAATARYAILRTAWLYGAGGRNFLKAILRAALKNREKGIRVVDDQVGCPTWANTLALQIVRVLAAGATGMFHSVSEGHCSRREQAAYFLERMGVPTRVDACRSEEYPAPARRPKNSILANRRLKTAGLNVMKGWASDMEMFVQRHGPQLLKEAQGKSA